MKRQLLWGAFAATLAAVYFAPQPDEVVTVTPTRASRHPIQPVAMTSRQASKDRFDLKIRPRDLDDELGNVFTAHFWVPAAPVEKAVLTVAPPPEPEAPPLPFRFLGRLIEDGKTVYFLQFNDRNLVMRVGDTIDNTYKLESQNGGALTFAYLPLDKKQTLAVGEVD